MYTHQEWEKSSVSEPVNNRLPETRIPDPFPHIGSGTVFYICNVLKPLCGIQERQKGYTKAGWGNDIFNQTSYGDP